MSKLERGREKKQRGNEQRGKRAKGENTRGKSKLERGREKKQRGKEEKGDCKIKVFVVCALCTVESPCGPNALLFHTSSVCRGSNLK